MRCTWYAVDYATATGPESYVAYEGFSAALASTAVLSQPGIVWGSPAADWNADGSGVAVTIYVELPALTWSWNIELLGIPLADNGSGFGSANTALAAAQASPFLPAGFCLEPTPPIPPADPCSASALMAAARCFKCIPRGSQKEAQLVALCVWSGGIIPGGFLLQSEGGYVVLDDGGRIVIN